MNLQTNWVDLVILLILFYFATEAWRHGVWVILAEFFSFLGSIILALRGYKLAAFLLEANFGLSKSVSNALGFLFVAVLAEFVLGYLLSFAIAKLPEKIKKIKYAKVLALIPAVGQGVILVSFVLMLLLGMPIQPNIKENISESKIGGYLISKTSIAEKSINEVFGDVINDSLTYLTIKPGSKEAISLNVNTHNLEVDPETEKAMFDLVNQERRKQAVEELVWRDDLVPVARDHARDMWQRKYFSHFSPDGDDVGDRLNRSQVKYYLAGENLALAPTLSLAHNGLMNSEGHRANILEPRFKRMGIGVIDNGYYGKMFVQVFTD